MEQPRCVTEYYITPSLHTHGARHSHTQSTASTCSLTQAPGGARRNTQPGWVGLGKRLNGKIWGAPAQGHPELSVELPGKRWGVGYARLIQCCLPSC